MKKLIFCLVLVVAITNNALSKSISDSTCIYFLGRDYAYCYKDSISGKGWLKPNIQKVGNEMYFKNNNSLVVKFSDGSVDSYVIDQSTYEYNEHREDSCSTESWFGLDKNGIKMLFEISVYKPKLIQVYITYKNVIYWFEPTYYDFNYKLK